MSLKKFFKKITKGVGGLFSGIARGLKKVVKSPLARAAILPMFSPEVTKIALPFVGGKIAGPLGYQAGSVISSFIPSKILNGASRPPQTIAPMPPPSGTFGQDLE